MIKRCYVAACCMAALFLTACQTGTSTANGATSTEDTAFKAEPFMSADAVLLDVRGNVKKLTVKTTDCDENGEQTIEEWSEKTFLFNRKKLAKLSHYNNAIITRNENGQIVSIDNNDEDEIMRRTQFFTYDEHGDLITVESHGYEWEGVKTMHYDEHGDVSWTEEKSCAEGVTTIEVEKYKILARDENGNWTKRLISTNCQSFGADSEEEDDGEEDVKTFGLEVREITYR